MQNKGTDYIRRLLKDKTRLKRWRKMILCLSCVVVFCTVYALILPAITLERKTVCGQEEHSHTEECYSSDGQLTCGRTEHKHTESCYADKKTSEKPSGDDSQQTPKKSQTEESDQSQELDQEQNLEQSQEQNREQNQSQLQTSDDGNAAQSEENGAATRSAEEDASVYAEGNVGVVGAPAAEGEGGSAATVAEGFDLSASENQDHVQAVTLQYYDTSTKEWVNIPESGEGTIPGNAKIKLTVNYHNVPINQLKDTYSYTMTYDVPKIIVQKV